MIASTEGNHPNLAPALSAAKIPLFVVRTDRLAEIPVAMEPMFYTYPFMRDANLVLAMSATFLRTQKKYGPRGYRYMLLEAGHVVQNLSLRAIELGLTTLCMGGFVDSLLNELIGLQPRKEGVIYTVAAGFDAAPPPG